MDLDELHTASESSLPLGAGVSQGVRSIVDEFEDEDLFMEDWRDPVVEDDGRRSMDLSNWCHDVERALSPVPSYLSMQSDSVYQSDMDDEGSITRLLLERTDSFSSSYSYNSDDFEIKRRKVRSNKDMAPQAPSRPELIRDPNQVRHPGLTVSFVFKAISKTLGKLPVKIFSQVKLTLWRKYPETFTTPPQLLDLVDVVDRLLEAYDLEVAMQIIRALLKDMRLGQLDKYLENLCIQNEVRYELRMRLKETYGRVSEGTGVQGAQTVQKDFDRVYSSLHICCKPNHGPNVEHEVRDIKKMNSHRDPGKMIPSEEVLGTAMIQDELSCRSLLTCGMPGMGKSMLVQKVIMDWVEERSHQHVYFLFPLPFRELDKLRGSPLSYCDLLYTFYPETKKLKKLETDQGEVMFICDGLDEYRGELSFRTTEMWHDFTKPTDMDILVVNLLRGYMLPNYLIWVTSRHRRARILPGEVVDRRTEVLGFSNIQKEEYFRRRFEDPIQAGKVIARLNSCKTLRIMCHLPLFCKVVSEEFRRWFRTQGPRAELPESITPMYTQLLLSLLDTRAFRSPPRTQDEETSFLMSVGKLAFTMLDKGGQLKITEDYIKQFGLDVEEAVVKSGLCIEYLMEEVFLFQEKVTCFIHCTVQEYLAALYVFLAFKNQGKNVLKPQGRGKIPRIFKDNNLLDLLKAALEKCQRTEDGSLDLMLRFLFGMTLNANYDLLKHFLSSGTWSSGEKDAAAALIKKAMPGILTPGRKAMLQCCLEELGEGT